MGFTLTVKLTDGGLPPKRGTKNHREETADMSLCEREIPPDGGGHVGGETGVYVDLYLYALGFSQTIHIELA